LHRSLAIKILHYEQENAANGSGSGSGTPKTSYPRRQLPAELDQEIYALDCCPELERLGQIYGAAGEMKNATESLSLALASRNREVRCSALLFRSCHILPLPCAAHEEPITTDLCRATRTDLYRICPCPSTDLYRTSIDLSRICPCPCQSCAMLQSPNGSRQDS